MPEAKFPLGRILATPGSLKAFSDAHEEPLTYLTRHASGDWGDVDREDWEENDQCINRKLRIFSAYHLHDGTKVWIITEADRSATTILLPHEY